MFTCFIHMSGAPRVRGLPPEQFCRRSFVIGKASEAGFGNEMYKILTGAALSVLLNRSLIIGQTRHVDTLSNFLFFTNFILLQTVWFFFFLSASSFIIYINYHTVFSLWT